MKKLTSSLQYKATQRVLVAGVLFFCMLVLCACVAQDSGNSSHSTQTEVQDNNANTAAGTSGDSVTSGSETYRGFTLDNVLHSQDEGDIHFNIYIPSTYDGSSAAALFVTLPGYQGLYFQGVGTNLETEDFGFEAQAYDSNMIVVAPQLADWGQTSARQTIELVEYLIEEYNIDTSRVFLEGYSGGGETLSLVMGMRPSLFRAALFCSSQWDGDLSVLADSQVPVYMVIGENDEYYGSEPARMAAEQLTELYRQKGFSQERIDELVTLDIKDETYFESAGVSNQHGGGGMLFSHDAEIMGWLFNR